MRDVNIFIVTRARRFVWAQDDLHEPFIADKMSTKLEPTPLLPNIGKYEPPCPAEAIKNLVDPA